MTVFGNLPGGKHRELEVVFETEDDVAKLAAFDENVIVTSAGVHVCSHEARWYFIPMSRVRIVQEVPE